MRLIVTLEKLEFIHDEVEREMCFAAGFKPEFPILRYRAIDPETGHDAICFEQDETPEKDGNNIECEYLKTLGG